MMPPSSNWSFYFHLILTTLSPQWLKGTHLWIHFCSVLPCSFHRMQMKGKPAYGLKSLLSVILPQPPALPRIKHMASLPFLAHLWNSIATFCCAHGLFNCWLTKSLTRSRLCKRNHLSQRPPNDGLSNNPLFGIYHLFLVSFFSIVLLTSNTVNNLHAIFFKAWHINPREPEILLSSFLSSGETTTMSIIQRVLTWNDELQVGTIRD